MSIDKISKVKLSAAAAGLIAGITMLAGGGISNVEEGKSIQPQLDNNNTEHAVKHPPIQPTIAKTIIKATKPVEKKAIKIPAGSILIKGQIVKLPTAKPAPKNASPQEKWMANRAVAVTLKTVNAYKALEDGGNNQEMPDGTRQAKLKNGQTVKLLSIENGKIEIQISRNLGKSGSSMSR